MPVPKWLAIGVYTFALFMILIGTAFGGTFVGSQQGVPNDKLSTGGSPCGALDDTSTVSAAGADTYFQSKGSPFDDHGQFIVASAQEFRVNPALMIGISNAESSLGKSGGLPIQNKNPGNVKTSTETLLAAGFKQGIDFSGHDGLNHVIFLKWEAGWRGTAEVLRRNYLNEGRDTLEKIAEKYLEGDKERWVKNASDAMSAVCEKESCGALAGPIQDGRLKIRHANDKEGLPKGEILRMDGKLVPVTTPFCEALADMLNQNLTIPTVTSIVGTHDRLSSSGKSLSLETTGLMVAVFLLSGGNSSSVLSNSSVTTG